MDPRSIGAILLTLALAACFPPTQPQFNLQSPEWVWGHRVYVAKTKCDEILAPTKAVDQNAEQNEGRFEVNNGCLVFEGSIATWLVVFPSSATIIVAQEHLTFNGNRIDFEEEFLPSGEPTNIASLEPLVVPIPTVCQFPLWIHF